MSQVAERRLELACRALPTFANWPTRIPGVPITHDETGPIAYAMEGHRLILGDPGEGKGTSVIAPMLLHDVRGENGRRAGMVVIDPKDAELVRLTRPVREQYSSPVFTLDPFGLAGETDSCNPIDMLDPNGIDFFGRCSGIARAIIGEAESDGRDGVHWQTRSRGLLAGLIGYVASAPDEERTLMRVREIIRAGPSEFETVADGIRRSTSAPSFVRQTGAELLRLYQSAPRELSGYLSVMSEHTDFLDEPRIARTLMRSNFSWFHVREVGATVYITCPDGDLALAAPWLRLMCEVALQAIRRSHLGAEAQRRACDVHMIIDEAKAFGPWRMIEDGLRALRSERIALHLAYQNLAQIRTTWREGFTRITAVKVIQFLGSNDVETCEWIAKLAGETTVIDRSRSWSEGDSETWGDSESTALSVTTNQGWSKQKGEGRAESWTWGTARTRGFARQSGISITKGASGSDTRSSQWGSQHNHTVNNGYSWGPGGGGSNGGSSSSSGSSFGGSRSSTDGWSTANALSASQSYNEGETENEGGSRSENTSSSESESSGNGMSLGQTRGKNTGGGHQKNASETETERKRLMTVQEVRALDPALAVVFIAREQGMLVRRSHHYENPALQLRILRAQQASKRAR